MEFMKKNKQSAKKRMMFIPTEDYNLVQGLYDLEIPPHTFPHLIHFLHYFVFFTLNLSFNTLYYTYQT